MNHLYNWSEDDVLRRIRTGKVYAEDLDKSQSLGTTAATNAASNSTASSPLSSQKKSKVQEDRVKLMRDAETRLDELLMEKRQVSNHYKRKPCISNVWLLCYVLNRYLVTSTWSFYLVSGSFTNHSSTLASVENVKCSGYTGLSCSLYFLLHGSIWRMTWWHNNSMPSYLPHCCPENQLVKPTLLFFVLFHLVCNRNADSCVTLIIFQCTGQLIVVLFTIQLKVPLSQIINLFSHYIVGVFAD